MTTPITTHPDVTITAIIKAMDDQQCLTTITQLMTQLPYESEAVMMSCVQNFILGIMGDTNALLRLNPILAPGQAMQISEQQEGIYDAQAWDVTFDWPRSTSSQAQRALLPYAWGVALLRAYGKHLQKATL